MNENPMGHEYTPEEVAAAVRQGIAGPGFDGGPLIWATGSGWPKRARGSIQKARRDARDWELLADAMDREWRKPLPEPTP